MDDEARHEHCVAFSNSLQRIAKVIESTRSSEVSVIVAEVLKLIRGFKIIGKLYADQLVMKAQEVRSLKMEKQALEREVQKLLFQLSSQVTSVVSKSGQPVARRAATTVKPATLEQLLGIEFESLGRMKDLHLEDHRECLKENSRLEIRLRETENQAAKSVKERRELVKTHTQEISEVKDDYKRLDGETVRLRKERSRLEEQLRMATLKNERFVEIRKSHSKLKTT
ncbi:hypothetical protein R1flu_022360 [Riccia fluitans]|uniref:Uncharacterized protein n=1 Tax=Riccia fluitans TaxID=41844 RepID=A0ABD1ZSN7_9MARC